MEMFLGLLIFLFCLSQAFAQMDDMVSFNVSKDCLDKAKPSWGPCKEKMIRFVGKMILNNNINIADIQPGGNKRDKFLCCANEAVSDCAFRAFKVIRVSSSNYNY